VIVAALVAATLALPTASADEPSPVRAGAERYIVLFHDEQSLDAALNSLERDRSFRASAVYRSAVDGFAASLTQGEVAALRADPSVLLVEADGIMSASEQVVPTGLDRIDAELNATAAIDGAGPDLDIDIAVIDSGIDSDHPDLNVAGGQAYLPQYLGNLIIGCNRPGAYEDANGHGTHVAGTAAARDNADGVVGVAPGARLWAVRVLGANGNGCTSDVIKGVDWVTANAATVEVANMSLGGGNSAALCTAINNAADSGVVVVVAAGNAATNAQNSSPANCASAVTVSAFADFDGAAGAHSGPTCRDDEDDSFADFSNYGSVVDIAAPGVCIRSTYLNGAYATGSGTSMASPHVAGAVALQLLANSLDPEDAEDIAEVVDGLFADALPQDSACGFIGDPDEFPEPVLWLGGECVVPPDLVPPDTTIDDGPAALTSATDAGFEFSSGEPESSFECQLDDGDWLPCSSPVSYSGLGEGAHIFRVAAIDTAGNLDPMPAEHYWTIDLTPPDTEIAPEPPAVTGPQASFSFEADEDATFECRLDGGAWVECSSPRFYSDLAGGSHTFEVAAIDAAGNTDPTPASWGWTVDLSPPDTQITDGPPADDDSGTAAFTFEATEDSTFACSLDGGPFVACTSPKTYTALAPGPHSFQVRATDALGNTDPTPASWAWTVDVSPPDTLITDGPPAADNSGTADFSFEATEPSTFTCSLDGGPFVDCTSPKTYTGLASGPHSFQVRATDSLGNADPTPATHDWSITLEPVLYLSLQQNQTVGGVPYANEDILAFDGIGYTLHFDGSDVGLATLTIDGFAFLAPGEVLLSFSSPGNVPGLSQVDDSDVVLFRATSLGSTTTGTFSLYFDGSDVGLTAAAEDVDALEVLPDGRLVISTSGNVSVNAITGVKQDLLVFTPSSLGAATAGTWAMYLDGSDVELAAASENIDAVAVGGSEVYLSTTGPFAALGLKAQDEDAVAIDATLGPDTSGAFETPRFFDGSRFGIALNDVWGISLPPASQ
jgi:hypothetical protein